MLEYEKLGNSDDNFKLSLLEKTQFKARRTRLPKKKNSGSPKVT